MTVVFAPAWSSALRGSISSACSKSSVARMATLSPCKSFAITISSSSRAGKNVSDDARNFATARHRQLPTLWGADRSATGPHSYQLQLGRLRLACAPVGFREVLANLREKLAVVLALVIGSAGEMRRELQLLNCLGVLASLQIDKTQGVEDSGIAGRKIMCVLGQLQRAIELPGFRVQPREVV